MKTCDSTIENIIRDIDWLTDNCEPNNAILHTLLDRISRWAITHSECICEEDAPVIDILALARHATEPASWLSMSMVQGYAESVFCQVFLVGDVAEYVEVNNA